MSAIKKLAGDTAIYGIPSIVGRLISFILVFFFAKHFSPEFLAPYIEFYAFAAFFFVVLPHGMETAFFNFCRSEKDYKKVFTTALYSVLVAALAFLGCLLLFRTEVAAFVGQEDHLSYVYWFGLIMAIDVLISLPFALLRFAEKAKKFAFIKSLGIVLNVCLNIFFIVVYPEWTGQPRKLEFIFISNLIASAAMLLILLPEIVKNTSSFDKTLWKKMFSYSWPLIILGFAGVINETFDRVLMRQLLPEDIAGKEIGIYGTFYRLSMIMTIFIQAFRYAAEPYFFAQSKKADVKLMYAKVLEYFVMVTGVIFLAVSMFKIEIAHLFVRNPSFFEHEHALTIIPILLLANLFIGVFYNLSIWYKINDKTLVGASIVAAGAILTVVSLFIFIPKYGFISAAYTTLAAYVFITVLSYVLGQRHYPIPYRLGKILSLLIAAIVLYWVYQTLDIQGVFNWGIRFLLLGVYFMLGYTLIIRPRKT